jgi:hypothetical protein
MNKESYPTPSAIHWKKKTWSIGLFMAAGLIYAMYLSIANFYNSATTKNELRRVDIQINYADDNHSKILATTLRGEAIALEFPMPIGMQHVSNGSYFSEKSTIQKSCSGYADIKPMSMVWPARNRVWNIQCGNFSLSHEEIMAKYTDLQASWMKSYTNLWKFIMLSVFLLLVSHLLKPNRHSSSTLVVTAA